MSEYVPTDPAAQTATQGPVARLIGVLCTPTKTFHDIARKPDWLAPLLVILVVSLVSAILTVPRMDFDTQMREQMEIQAKKNPNASPQQMEQGMRIAKTISKSAMYMRPVFAVGLFAVLALIYFLGVRIAGGDASFLAIFAVTLYARMPGVIRQIGNTIVAMTKSSIAPDKVDMLLRSNLGFLVDMKSNPVGWATLTFFDVFTIWSIIVMIIGLAELPKMNRAKATAVVGVVAAIGLLFSIGAVSFAVFMRRGA